MNKQEVVECILQRLGIPNTQQKETNTDCLGYLVRILNLLDLPLPSSVFSNLVQKQLSVQPLSSPPPRTSDGSVWNVFQQIMDSSPGVRTKEEALKGMGYFVRQMLNFIDLTQETIDCGQLQHILTTWTMYIMQYSREDQTYEFRDASISSIAIAGLSTTELKTHKTDQKWREVTREAVIKATLQQWIAVVDLLQDDDEDIRHKASCFASSVIWKENPPTPGQSRPSWGCMRAISEVLDFLRTHFCEEMSYHAYLVRCVTVSKDEFRVARSIFSNLVGSHPVFEVEPANFFAEGLVTTQLACYHIQGWRKINLVEGETLQLKGLRKFYSDTLLALKVRLEKQISELIFHLKSTTSIRAVDSLHFSYHPVIFHLIYKLLVGIYLVVTCGGGEEHWLSAQMLEMRKVSECIKFHPILDNFVKTLSVKTNLCHDDLDGCLYFLTTKQDLIF
eukprot:TRINITY_DN8659_c0_g1_i1.p1 TRINITY_DN8659_c0_g1~~TRINITY_DN8659_c0_g1_i1.p1  ORF type:complete len:448 (-),score=123.62 TRINITY_DN8659_c0_g1_i1:50-1393(-)